MKNQWVELGARLGGPGGQSRNLPEALGCSILSFSKKMWDRPMRVEGIRNTHTHVEKAQFSTSEESVFDSGGFSFFEVGKPPNHG